MKAFSVGRIAGIDIRIHSTFFLLPPILGAAVGWSSRSVEAALYAAVTVLLIFVCVLGHELTHSFCAKGIGIHVPDITFYPMGGVASLCRIPEKPAEEALIAFVGPMFNFLLAGLLYYPLVGWMGRDALFTPNLRSWEGVLSNVFWANPVLAAFNLLPAYPMDGGRILRAFLTWVTRSHAKSTRISAFLGMIFAIGFILLGLRSRTWMLVLVGIYVFGTASREWRAKRSDRPFA